MSRGAVMWPSIACSLSWAANGNGQGERERTETRATPLLRAMSTTVYTWAPVQYRRSTRDRKPEACRHLARCGVLKLATRDSRRSTKRPPAVFTSNNGRRRENRKKWAQSFSCTAKNVPRRVWVGAPSIPPPKNATKTNMTGLAHLRYTKMLRAPLPASCSSLSFSFLSRSQFP